MTSVHVEANLYSGRRNPSWSLTEKQASECVRRLRALKPAASRDRAEPGLGYSGLSATVRSGSQQARYNIAEGVVMVNGGASSRTSSLQDRGQELEMWLLQTGAATLDRDTLSYMVGEVRRQSAKR